MTTYGYRLFTIELRKGFGQRAAEFSDCDGSHYIDLLSKLFGRLATTKIGKPVLKNMSGPSEDSSGEGDDAESGGVRGEPAIRVEDTQRNEWAVTGSVRSGTFGDHEIALGKPGAAEDTDLLNRAPVRRHRFVFVLPEVGTRGVLALETIGRSCPISLLTQWMSKASQDEASDNPKDGGEPVAWWRVVADQISDDEHLNDLIKSGRFGKIELVKHDITPDRKRTKEHLRLTAPHIEKGLASEVARVVRDWLASKRTTGGSVDNLPVSDSTGAHQLAAIVANGVENIDFDDGWVVLEDESGRTNKISPSRMAEVFTYTLSIDDRVSDVAFYQAARARAVRIGPSVPVAVEWPALQLLESR